MLCHYLGIPMAPEKTFGPSSTISFAGIELDSVKMEARLPPDRLAKCQDLIWGFLRHRSYFTGDSVLDRVIKLCMFSSCSWSAIPAASLALKQSMFRAYRTNWLILCLGYSCRLSNSWHQLPCTKFPQ